MSRYTIKIKNKHLVIAFALLLSFVGIARASGGDYLFKRAEIARENHDPIKALAYYDKFISEYPDDGNVPTALYWSASLLPDTQSFTAVIFPSHSSTTRSNDIICEIPEGALTREERLWRICTEHPHHWAAPHAMHQLAIALYHSGDPRSEELLLKAAGNERNGNRVDAALLLVDMYIASGRLDEAQNMLDYCAREMPTFLPEQQQFKRGDLLAAMGDYEGAKTAYEDVLAVFDETAKRWQAQSAQDDSVDPRPSGIESTCRYYREEVNAKIASLEALAGTDGSARTGDIEGIVLLDGKPLTGVRILVSETKDPPSFSTSYSEIPTRWIGNDGKFSFTLPADRRYEVGIELGYEESKKVEGRHLQMDGAVFTLQPGETKNVELRFVEPVKVIQPSPGFAYDGEPFTIKWDPYPGADSYTVSFSSISTDEHGYSSIGTGSVKTAAAILKVDKIPGVAFGVSGMDDIGVLPVYLIGAADAYSLQVQALDEHGNVISSSSGLYFGSGPNPIGLIGVERGELSEAEKLLMSREYDEAVRKLEERVENDPHDIRALEILARVYFMGTYYKDDNWAPDDMAHRDLERGREMLEILAALEPSKDHLEALATVCMNQVDREGAAAAYRLLQANGLEDSTALNALAYHALAVEDNYLEGLAYAERARLLADEHYDPLPLTGLYLITGQCDKAVEMLHSLGPGAGAERRTKLLEESLRAYVDLYMGSSRVNGRQSNYLGKVSRSFQEAQQIWEEDETAHSSFLLLAAKISDPWRCMYRSELRSEMDAFRAKYGKDAPVLMNVLEAFAWAGWL